MRSVSLLVLLSFVFLGAADLDCETLLKPMHNHDELKGTYHCVGGSSFLPGSRTWAFTLSGAWVKVISTSSDPEFIQAQRMFGTCINIKYKMASVNGSLVMEQPEHSFYLRDDHLMTSSPDCVTLYETAISGSDTYYSLLLFCRSMTVPDSQLELLKKQAECLKMPSVILLNKHSEPCPDDPAPMDGAEAFRFVLEAKAMHMVSRVMDAIFDVFIN